MRRAARWWIAGAVVLVLGAGLVVASIRGVGSPHAAGVNSGEAESGTQVEALTLNSLEGKRLDVPSDPAYPFAIDGGGTLAGRYGVTALGTTVVYDAEGRIVARLIEPSKEQLASAFKQAGAS